MSDLAPSFSGYGGLYRGVFLGADGVGNVKCSVPAVTGSLVITALSADLAGMPTPGTLGWVLYESGDPSRPVWIGSAELNHYRTTGTVTAVTNYANPIQYQVTADGRTYSNPTRLNGYTPAVGDTVIIEIVGSSVIAIGRTNSGWVDDAAARGIAVITTGLGAITLGNGLVEAQYKLSDGECRWYGHFQLGTTTSIPASAAYRFVLPVPMDVSSFSSSPPSPIGASIMGGGGGRAYNGNYFPGAAEFGRANTSSFSMFSTDGTGAGAAPTAASLWTSVVPFTFAAGNIVSWDVRYPLPH